MELKNNKTSQFEFIFQNSDIILTIPRLYLTVLIKKNNSSSLFPSAQNHEFISTSVFSLRIDKLTIVELNRVIQKMVCGERIHLIGSMSLSPLHL